MHRISNHWRRVYTSLDDGWMSHNYYSAFNELQSVMRCWGVHDAASVEASGDADEISMQRLRLKLSLRPVGQGEFTLPFFSQNDFTLPLVRVNSFWPLGQDEVYYNFTSEDEGTFDYALNSHTLYSHLNRLLQYMVWPLPCLIGPTVPQYSTQHTLYDPLLWAYITYGLCEAHYMTHIRTGSPYRAHMEPLEISME